MSINGKILIDKIRINIPYNVVVEEHIESKFIVADLRETLSKYFYKGAYSVSVSRGDIRITLTPTRYITSDGLATDVNLEMPSENWLLNLFIELGFTNYRLAESTRITWIHLTKNLIMNLPVINYIHFLHSLPCKDGLKPSIISSDENNDTLRFSRPKRNIDKEDSNGHFNIIFYNKTKQLKDKANLESVYLKQELTLKERRILKFHNVFYIPQAKQLYFHNLNLLRCEQQYRYKEKIAPIAQHLTGDNKEKVLTVATLMGLLEEGQLYNKLNEFYNTQLQKYIFYNPLNSNNTKTIKQLRNYNRVFNDLIHTNKDISELYIVFKALGLEDNFSKYTKKAFGSNAHKLYEELYKKFGFVSAN